MNSPIPPTPPGARPCPGCPARRCAGPGYRLGKDASRARDLLRPRVRRRTGTALGRHLGAPGDPPRRTPYTDEDLLWLRTKAGSYIVETADPGRSAYKLSHQAMAEHLREDV